MLILYAVMGYLFVGVLFALLFVTLLIHKVDKGSIGVSWSFRVIIFPGCVIFWPVLLKKYLASSKDQEHD